MNKVEKNGKVAVLYSPGFGAGWSTWNDEDLQETLCMDERLVNLVLAGKNKEVAKQAKKLFPKQYLCVLGVDTLEVAWVPKGKQFKIHEYDGSELVYLAEDEIYMTA